MKSLEQYREPITIVAWLLIVALAIGYTVCVVQKPEPETAAIVMEPGDYHWLSSKWPSHVQQHVERADTIWLAMDVKITENGEEVPVSLFGDDILFHSGQCGKRMIKIWRQHETE